MVGFFFASPTAGVAQSTNGTITFTQETLTAGGGQVGSGNPMRAITLIGQPAGGLAANGAFTVITVGSVVTEIPPELSIAVTVTGTTDEPQASVTLSVNGQAAIPATVANGQFTATGVRLYVGPNTLSATATDAAGNATSRSITVYVDVPAALKTPTFVVDVLGSVDDPLASVSVNGVAATIASGRFAAKAVSLTEGFNVLTATATDRAGNATSRTIGVFVDTTPPPRPTVGTLGVPVPTVTTATSLRLGGTKTQGTSIWINGKPVAPLNDETIWVTEVSLIEGDNDLQIVAKDVAGNASAANAVTIVLDNLPPVLSGLGYRDLEGQILRTDPATSFPKTNFSPVTIRGSVDDRLTTVEMNGIVAVRSGRDFGAVVPLGLGTNALTLVATSPNGWVTTQTLRVIRGTIPTMTAIQPADGMKRYAEEATSIQATATDNENDPLACQILLDGIVLVDWSSGTAFSWTPTLADLGLRTLEMRVRDGFGDFSSQQAEVYVLRKPVPPP